MSLLFVLFQKREDVNEILYWLYPDLRQGSSQNDMVSLCFLIWSLLMNFISLINTIYTVPLESSSRGGALLTAQWHAINDAIYHLPTTCLVRCARHLNLSNCPVGQSL